MYVIQSPLVHIISLISSSFWVRFNPEIKILWFQLYSVLLIKKKQNIDINQIYVGTENTEINEIWNKIEMEDRTVFRILKWSMM